MNFGVKTNSSWEEKSSSATTNTSKHSKKSRVQQQQTPANIPRKVEFSNNKHQQTFQENICNLEFMKKQSRCFLLRVIIIRS